MILAWAFLLLQDPAEEPSKDVYASWSKYLAILKSEDPPALKRFLRVDREYVIAHAHRWIKAIIKVKSEDKVPRRELVLQLLDAFAALDDYSEQEKFQSDAVRARLAMADKMSSDDAKRYVAALKSLDEAEAIESKENREQAEAAYRDYCKIMKEFGDPERLAHGQEDLTQFYAKRHRWADAAEAAEAWRQSAEALGDLSMQMAALDRRMDAFESLDRWTEYLACAESSLKVAIKSKQIMHEVGARTSIAQACRHLKRFDEAVRYAEEALAASKKSPIAQALCEPQLHRELGLIFEEMGRLDDALRHLQLALDRYPSIDEFRGSKTAVLNDIGTLNDILGRRDKAREAYEQGLALARESGDRESIARLLGNLGTVDMNTSRFHDAIRRYEESLKILRELGLRSVEGDILGNLAVVYELIGQYDLAKRDQEKSLAIARESGDRLRESAVLLNLGALLYKTQARMEALAKYQEALKLKQELGDRPGQIKVQNNLAILLISAKRYDEAIQMLKEALALARELGRRGEEGDTLLNLGRSQGMAGRPEEAVATLREALAIQRELGARLQEAIVYLNLGEVALSQKKQGEALASFDESIQALETLRGTLGGMEAEKAAWMDSYRTIYEAAVAAQLRAGQPDEAVGLLEKMRSRNLLDALSRSESAWKGVPKELRDRKNERQSAFNLRRRELEQARRSAKPEERAEIERRQKEIRDIEAQLKDVTHEIELHQTVEEARPLSAREIRACLREGEALLMYCCLRPESGETRRRVLVVVMTARGGVETFGIDQAESLLKDVEWLRAAARASGHGLPAREFKARAAKIYAYLLKPAEEWLRKAEVHTLLIAPDEVLYQLPFEALVASDRGEGYSELDYVGRRWAVQYVHSGTLLAVRRAHPGKFDGAVVAFGDPDYGTVKESERRGDAGGDVPEDLKKYFGSEGERGGWSRLPFSRDEATEIAKLFGAEPKLGKMASEREARSIGGARFLHFACHGSIDGSEPMRSALVLTADSEHDGYLEAREIADLRMPCELVVLSACDSASGVMLRGEGLIGLTRAFLYAGARSVAASLWSVSDEGGKEFMIAFYRKLAAGKDKAQALAETKREFLQSDKYCAPYYWAGFILFGD